LLAVRLPCATMMRGDMQEGCVRHALAHAQKEDTLAPAVRLPCTTMMRGDRQKESARACARA